MTNRDSLLPSALDTLSMAGMALTPVALLAAVVGFWRLGVEPGWTSQFFIAHGLLSRHQLWFAIAIAAQGSAIALKRWTATHREAAAK